MFCSLIAHLSLAKSLNSKITLIHNVWTTKGNHHAFMGISAAYISEDWVFCICHLGLKYISWTHKGKYLAIPFAKIITKSSLHQMMSFYIRILSSHPISSHLSSCVYILAQTKELGSKNCTMTAEVDHIIARKLGTNINLSSNHIQCLCHKIALILLAGLKAIGTDLKGLTRSKESTLGFVPKLVLIAKESDELNDIQEAGSFRSDELNEDLKNQSNNEEISAFNSTKETSTISARLKKVDIVIQRITSSASKQSEFKLWASKLDYNGPTLIAGYGI